MGTVTAGLGAKCKLKLKLTAILAILRIMHSYLRIVDTYAVTQPAENPIKTTYVTLRPPRSIWSSSDTGCLAMGHHFLKLFLLYAMLPENL